MSRQVSPKGTGEGQSWVQRRGPWGLTEAERESRKPQGLSAAPGVERGKGVLWSLPMECDPKNPLISDFWFPDLGENTFLLLCAPSPGFFATEAPENQYREVKQGSYSYRALGVGEV